MTFAFYAVAAVCWVLFIWLLAAAVAFVLRERDARHAACLTAAAADDLMDLADTLDGWQSFVDAHPELAPEETR